MAEVDSDSAVLGVVGTACGMGHEIDAGRAFVLERKWQSAFPDEKTLVQLLAFLGVAGQVFPEALLHKKAAFVEEYK